MQRLGLLLLSLKAHGAAALRSGGTNAGATQGAPTSMSNFRHAHILGLMSVAVAAYGVSVGSQLRTALIMAALLAGAAAATILYERRAVLTAPRATAAPAQSGFVQTKRMLMLMMVIGIVVYSGGAGTFSSFSAETSNTNSSVAAGTLTMSDTVNGSTATACAS